MLESEVLNNVDESYQEYQPKIFSEKETKSWVSNYEQEKSFLSKIKEKFSLKKEDPYIGELKKTFVKDYLLNLEKKKWNVFSKTPLSQKQIEKYLNKDGFVRDLFDIIQTERLLKKTVTEQIFSELQSLKEDIWLVKNTDFNQATKEITALGDKYGMINKIDTKKESELLVSNQPKIIPVKREILDFDFKKEQERMERIRNTISYPFNEYFPISSKFSLARPHPTLRKMKNINGIDTEIPLIRPHYGIDIAASKGTPILSMCSWTVISNSWETWWGWVITIQQDSWRTFTYKHMQEKSLLLPWNFIYFGQEIGKVWDTWWISSGPHLHLEIRDSWKPLNPLACYPDVLKWKNLTTESLA